MAIGKIFAHRAYTDNGNEYNKTNYGKTACTALGATGAAIGVRRFNKLINQVFDEFKPSQFIEGTLSNEELASDEVKNFIKGFDKNAKKYSKRGILVLGALVTGVALGIGAIIDGIANSVKRHKADKAANNIA